MWLLSRQVGDPRGYLDLTLAQSSWGEPGRSLTECLPGQNEEGTNHREKRLTSWGAGLCGWQDPREKASHNQALTVLSLQHQTTFAFHFH